MSVAVLRAVLADHGFGRRLLAGLAVAVATAFATASVLLTGAAAAAIVRELAGTPLDADLVVTPADPEVEQRVARAPGVEAVAAAGAGPVARLVEGGTTEAWTALRAGGPLTRHPLVAGRPPAAPDEAAVSERSGIAPGATLELLAADGAPRTLTVTGVVAVRAEPLAAVVVPSETATDLTGSGPVQLDVKAAVDRAQLAALLGPDVQVRDAAEVRTAELDAAFGGGLAGVLAALTVFAGTAALAAVLATTCVLGVLAGRQRRTVGLLRRAGATRGQVLRALLADAALTGATAGAAGAALGLGLAELVRLAVRAGLGEDLPSPGLPWPVLLAGAGGALLATVLAAVGPAVRLAGEPPVAVPALRPRHGRRLQLAALLAAGSTALVLVPAGDPQLALTLVAAAGALAFAAAMAAGPVLLPALAALLGLPFAVLVPGRIAVRSTRRAPLRATATVTALVLTGMLLTAVLVGLQSMTLSVDDRIAARFPAPVTVVAAGDGTLPADLAERVASAPGAGAVAPVQAVPLAAAPGTTAVDPAAFPPLLAGAVDAGTLGDLAPGTVALDRAQAAAWGVGVGRVLDLGGGDQRPVVAVYRSSGVLGPVTVHPADAAGAPVRQVLVAPAAGTDPVALRDAVARAVGQDPTALVLAPAALRDELAGAVRLVRAAALGLLAVTVLVAVVGVAVSLVLSVRERRGESAVLRRLGLTPGQVVAAVGLENALLGLAAALVGTGLGGLFGVLAVFALREAAVVPLDQVGMGAAALALVAALAGTLPAVRTARGA